MDQWIKYLPFDDDATAAAVVVVAVDDYDNYVDDGKFVWYSSSD